MKFICSNFLILTFACVISCLKAQEVQLSPFQLSKFQVAMSNTHIVAPPVTTGSITGNVDTRHKKNCTVHIESYKLGYHKILRLDDNGNFFVNGLEPSRYSIRVLIPTSTGTVTDTGNYSEGASDGFVGAATYLEIIKPYGTQIVNITAGVTITKDFKAAE